MQNQKVLIALVVILAIGLIAEGIYLVNLKKQIKAVQDSYVQPRPLALLKKKSLLGTKNWLSKLDKFDHYWGRDDFFSREWNPFSEMERIQRQLNKMFNESFGRGIRSQGLWPSLNSSFFEPDIDIQETKTYYIIKMDLPGMQKDQIDIEIKDKMLTVSGEKEAVQEENKAGKYFRKERSYGRFLRTIPLPQDIKENSISADYKNGVLTIKIAKSSAPQKQEQPKKIQVL